MSVTRRAVAAALAAALLAGACSPGGEGEGEGEGDGDAATTTAAPTTTATVASTTTTTTAAAPPAPRPMRATGDPAELAARIERVEVAMRDRATPAADFATLADEQQRAYRELSADDSLAERTIARLPDWLADVARANTTAGADLRALTKPRDSLPAWRIVEPAPAAELEGYYREAEARYGVPWQYLAAIHLVETRMGRIRGTSSAGARGPMQFMPATWEQYGEGGDIESNHDSILAAARYLKRNGAPERMPNALFAYNRSDRYVRAVTRYAEQIVGHSRAYLAYHHWQVWYRLRTGDVLLPVGWQGEGA